MRGDTMGPIVRYLTEDHAGLDTLLRRGASDSAAYDEFRRRLLRHIGMEEKVLLPAAQRIRGGERLPAPLVSGSITERWPRCSCRPPPR